MPIVYVRDRTSQEIIRIEESFSSLVWTERYQEAGDFVLEIPISVANFDVYRRGNYVQIDESDETMLIETLNINDEVEDPLLEVSGRSLACILERRVNASRLLDNFASAIAYNGSFGDVLDSIVKGDITEPTMQTFIWMHTNADGTHEEGYDSTRPSSNYKAKETISTPYRKINNFSYINTVTGVTVSKNYNKIMSIYDLLVSISKKCVTGFSVLLQNGNFVLKTYKGVDRTSSQKVLDPVIFDPVMDNITYVNYFEDQTDYRNVALSYGDGPWSPVDENVSASPTIFDGYVWVTKNEDAVNTSITGIDRFELPIDARSSSSGDDSEGISAKIEAAATDEFDTGDHDFVKTSEGAIDPLVRYKFGEDYFLGDMVEISNNSGVVMTAVIDEVVTSYDSDGLTITPNFTSMEDYDYGDEREEETA